MLYNINFKRNITMAPHYLTIDRFGTSVSKEHDDELYRRADLLCQRMHHKKLAEYAGLKHNLKHHMATAIKMIQQEDNQYQAFNGMQVEQVKQFIAAATKLNQDLRAREMIGEGFDEIFHENQINVHTKFLRETEEGHIKVLQVVNKWLAVTLGYAVTYDNKDYDLMFALTIHDEVKAVKNTGYKDLVSAINLRTDGDLDNFKDGQYENKGLVFLAEKIRQIILSELLLSDDSTLGAQIIALRNSYTALQSLTESATVDRKKVTL